MSQCFRACTPVTEAFKKEKEQTHWVAFSVLLYYTEGVTLRGLMTLVPWFQAASEARHHVAVSKSLQRTRGTPITWRSNPSCNCETAPSSKFRDARTMKCLPRKLQDGVQLVQGRGLVLKMGRAGGRGCPDRLFGLQRIPFVIDGSHWASGLVLVFLDFSLALVQSFFAMSLFIPLEDECLFCIVLYRM